MKILLFFALLLFSIQSSSQLRVARACLDQHCQILTQLCTRDPHCKQTMQSHFKDCLRDADCLQKKLNDQKSELVLDFFKCYLDNHCDKLTSPLDKCIKKHCKQDLDPCFKESRCKNVALDCDNQCESNSCISKCLVEKEDLFSKCIVKIERCLDYASRRVVKPKRPALSQTFKYCLLEKCGQKVRSCTKDYLCMKPFLLCQDQCEDEEECYTTCVPSKGNQLATEIVECGRDSKCITPPQLKPQLTTCINQKCSNEKKTCTEDSKCFAAFLDCEDNCKDNKQCWLKCLEKNGNQGAKTFYKCTIDNCIQKKEEIKEKEEVSPIVKCMNNSCGQEQENCQEDQVCSRSLGNCKTLYNNSYDLGCLYRVSRMSQTVKAWFKCGSEASCL